MGGCHQKLGRPVGQGGRCRGWSATGPLCQLWAQVRYGLVSSDCRSDAAVFAIEGRAPRRAVLACRVCRVPSLGNRVLAEMGVCGVVVSRRRVACRVAIGAAHNWPPLGVNQGDFVTPIPDRSRKGLSSNLTGFVTGRAVSQEHALVACSLASLVADHLAQLDDALCRCPPCGPEFCWAQVGLVEVGMQSFGGCPVRNPPF